MPPAKPAVPRPLTLALARPLAAQDPLAVWIGFSLEVLQPGRVESAMLVEPKHLSPTGFLHAAVLTAFADLTCGFGTAHMLPEEAFGFTTLEIKTNHLATSGPGPLRCIATARHTGTNTQVWDADITHPHTNKTIVLFRCSQMLLYTR